VTAPSHRPCTCVLKRAAIEYLTSNPVRSQYCKPGSPRSQIPDAIIVAPAPYNTVNKWAQGTSDTYALGVLAEMTRMGTPIVVLPFVNSALASRIAFRRSVDPLGSERVHILPRLPVDSSHIRLAPVRAAPSPSMAYRAR
jgi:flavoprotein